MARNPIAPFESLRERNVAARRQRILDAARRILLRDGLAGLSMRKLADEADLAVKTLYNLWGGRGSILAALVEDAMDRMDGALEREAPLDDPLERCRAVVTVSIREIVEDEAVFRPMVIASQENRAGDDARQRDSTTRATRMQAVAIRAAIEQGLLRDLLDPEQLGRQIHHGYEMALLRWASGDLDEEGFRARALYGLYVALLGVASDAVRPSIEAELRRLEPILRAQGAPEPGLAQRRA